MNRRKLLKGISLSVPSFWLSRAVGKDFIQDATGPLIPGMAKGPFNPDWKSLQQYKVPQWYKNAKFGIWAHWGPQCQPERGDWYARGMYQEGSDQYKFHIEKYGHPSKFGFKDVINEWKAEQWNPDELMALYKRTGAQYFVALANHHDNFDLYNSSYQPWNSTKMGPRKDIVGGWAKAAKKQGITFGVSVHSAHAWSWLETAQRSDKSGPEKGVPYDGKTTKADGSGKWWAGYNPQDLYEQDHALSENSQDNGMIHKQWNWGNGVNVPTKAYCDKFLNRTIELIDKYKPDLVYFDDTALPLWPISDAGLKIAAHMYNNSIKRNGELRAVINGKILSDEQKKCLVWDIERGQSDKIEPDTWQTCTCIGSWHYDRRIYDKHGYKSAKNVIQMLADVVSKNGNLLLSVPLRGDGTIDSDERAIVEDIATWMTVNQECIYDTRPWKIFGEGPAQEHSAPLSAQGFNEGKGKPFTAEDIRFTTKNGSLYAIILGIPGEELIIKSLSSDNRLIGSEKIANVNLLGFNEKLNWEQTATGLKVTMPNTKPSNHTIVLKIKGLSI